MSNTQQTSNPVTEVEPLDVLVVGAGFGGINALHVYRSAGLSVRLLEAGMGVGGTWFWNRYPGARVDIESLEYSYGFSDEIQQEWSWSMRYAEQPEVERYLNWVTDKLDLRKDMQFDAHVTWMEFDEATALWNLETATGERFRARHCVMAVGFLSAPHWPDLPGLDTFKGELVHTGQWRDDIELEGKRIGVIGTAATGVQLIPKLAEIASHLSVFQRTANWAFPIKDMPMPKDYERYVKENYAEIRRQEHEQPGYGVVLVDFKLKEAPDKSALEVSDEEREREFEERWQTGGLNVARSYTDLAIDRRANDLLRDFCERKIRSVVKDPKVAELLIPRDHGPLLRRPCGETNYYETYNRSNVTLVDVKSDPIVEVTESGVKLASGAEHEVDVLIAATGFDAGSGGLLRIDIRGRDGQKLADAWSEGVSTHLGLTTRGFPNLFFVNGMQSPSAFFSPPLLADFQNKLVVDIIRQVEAAGGIAIEPTEEAQAAWVQECEDIISATLYPTADSWWMGANIEGKKRQVVSYPGGMAQYRVRALEAADGLAMFEVHRQDAAAAS
ncbi:MAG: flavin-containing monooxygenase [Mycobacteriaceae bacterium]